MVAPETKDVLSKIIKQMSNEEKWALYEILQEYKYPSHERAKMTTNEQAYGLLLGEVVETWEFAKRENTEATRSQVRACAAIALKFMVNLLQGAHYGAGKTQPS